MSRLIQEFVKLVILICFVVGGFLTYKTLSKQLDPEHEAKKKDVQVLDRKSELLKQFLVSNGKPQRIEISNLTTRYQDDVKQIQKMKVAQDKNASFYVSIQFFTDENDKSAPLVAQVRFIDLKSGNTIKEESLNLE